MYKRGTPEYAKWRKSPKYALYCKRISIANTGKHHSAETRAKISATHMGKQISAETRAKLSMAHMGKHPSAATRAKLSTANSGERNPFYGKHHSVEARTKMSAAHMGKQISVETRTKMGNAQRGRRHSVEARAKMSAAKMGKPRSTETCAKMSIAMIGRHPSAETRAKMSIARIGKRNPNWRGGISSDPYPRAWTNLLREAIRKRDNFTCVLCGKEQNKRRHPVHHINYNKKDIRPENLVTLCTECHLKTNGDREYWKNLFDMIYVPDFPKRRTENESCCR